MCIQFHVVLPTLYKFLMLYSLHSGCLLLMFWYFFRTIACIFFAAIAIPELFTGGKSAFKKYLLITETPNPDRVEEIHYFVYGNLMAFLMTETILFVHSCNLIIGVMCHEPPHVRSFLLCRVYTWAFEIGSLIILCVIHKILMGWYLVILMVVFLEAYSFVVIYSYYTEMLEEAQHQQQKEQSYTEWGDTTPYPHA